MFVVINNNNHTVIFLNHGKLHLLTKTDKQEIKLQMSRNCDTALYLYKDNLNL